MDCKGCFQSEKRGCCVFDVSMVIDLAFQIINLDAIWPLIFAYPVLILCQATAGYLFPNWIFISKEILLIIGLHYALPFLVP